MSAVQAIVSVETSLALLLAAVLIPSLAFCYAVARETPMQKLGGLILPFWPFSALSLLTAVYSYQLGHENHCRSLSCQASRC